MRSSSTSLLRTSKTNVNPRRWVAFFYTYSELPKPRTAFSTYVGSLLLVVNLVARFWSDGLVVVGYTRPLSEVVCVAGVTMTIMLPVRRYEDTVFWPWWTQSMVGHLLIGLSAWGASVTTAGLVVCTGTLLAALVVYWTTFACGYDSWPYQLAPAELAGLCLTLVLMRVI